MRGAKIRFMLLIFLGVISYGLNILFFTSLKAEGKSLPLLQGKNSYDLVIKHAFILDGTGEKERFRGDIAIKEGIIAEVGEVQVQEGDPVFDAGGLTVMPMPVRPQGDTALLEHLFRTSYPRYPAHYLYFQDSLYQGFSLEQVARQRGETPQQTFNYLQKQLPAQTKVYLMPITTDSGVAFQPESLSLQELAAYLTVYPAQAMGENGRGAIKPGHKADLCFFLTRDYDEKSLKQLFLKGQTPEPVLSMIEGRWQENV